MANSMQARKRVRQTARRTAINRRRTSRIRSYVRKVEEAIASGDKAAAAGALRAAQPEIARGAKTGILHRNTASRKLSRLARRIAKM